MAARRLIVVMIVLLAISTLAAALIPADPKTSGNGTTGAQTSRTAPDRAGPELDAEPLPGNGLVTAQVRISNRPPKTIVVKPGEQLVLEVSATFGDDVEIPSLGLVETMTNNAPAVFDIYADKEGTFGVRTVETDLLVAKIVVSALPPEPAPSTKSQSQDPKPPRAEAKPQSPAPGERSGGAGPGAHGVQRGVAPGPQLQ